MNVKVMKQKLAKRIKRKRSIRSKISGCATLPRVSVYLSAQAIDDTASVTLAAIHSKANGLRANKDGAAALGAAFAATLKAAGITAIVFDRNGYQYHGVIAAFGEALRANEIKF